MKRDGEDYIGYGVVGRALEAEFDSVVLCAFTVYVCVCVRALSSEGAKTLIYRLCGGGWRAPYNKPC